MEVRCLNSVCVSEWERKKYKEEQVLCWSWFMNWSGDRSVDLSCKNRVKRILVKKTTSYKG